MTGLRLAGALIALIVAAAPAAAENFPSRPVTMMVGFPPGGPTDTLARIMATGRVAHAKPDGYTIGIGQWSSHVASPAIYPLDYDVLRDL